MKIQGQSSHLLPAVLLCFLFANGHTTTADTTRNTVSAVSLPRKTPLYSDWRLVAQSDMIVQGRLRVPVASLRAALRANKREYIPVRLDVTRVLKGKPETRTLAVQIYSAGNSNDVSPQKVISLHGKDVMAFIVAPDDVPNPGSLYFAGYTPNGLAASSRWLTGRVEGEVSNQKRISIYYARPGAFASTPLDDKVKRLIVEMLDERTQFQSFADLEELGDAAVPATIRWMDDRRPLAVPHIALRNKSPQAFEATRQYSPRLVVDALDAILNQVTGEFFGSLGDLLTTEAHRKQTVNAWRTYLYYGRPKNNT
jgi:hypothetical protein